MPNPEPGTQNPEPLARIRFKCQRTSQTDILARRTLKKGGPLKPATRIAPPFFDVKHFLSDNLQTHECHK